MARYSCVEICFKLDSIFIRILFIIASLTVINRSTKYTIASFRLYLLRF